MDSSCGKFSVLSIVPQCSWAPQFKTHLPEQYEVLEINAEIIPGGNRTPVHPFLGFVININVATKAHRDATDFQGCLVMVISKNLVGGDLVLVEPGIVIPLNNGDFIIFPSCDITHFNLHYKGWRASFVFQTDKRIQTWACGFNGWGANSFVGTGGDDDAFSSPLSSLSDDD